MRFLPIAFVLALTACGFSIEDKRPVTVVACDAFQPIYVAEATIPKLDRETKEDIAIHNRVWERMCKK